MRGEKDRALSLALAVERREGGRHPARRQPPGKRTETQGVCPDGAREVRRRAAGGTSGTRACGGDRFTAGSVGHAPRGGAETRAGDVEDHSERGLGLGGAAGSAQDHVLQGSHGCPA